MSRRLDFAGGQWVSVSSSWVVAIRWDAEEQELSVEFKDGAVCVYDVDAVTAFGMFEASSHGKYVHKHLFSLPYRLGV